MKYILLRLLILSCVFSTSCHKSKDFEGIRPDSKLQETLTQYDKQLLTADNGWMAYLFPGTGGGFTFHITFKENNRVSMQADLNPHVASTSKESSYRLKATQVPCLYFDTYSYIHQIADPDPLISGGVRGKGRYADFEFSIVSVQTDTIRLKGNLNGSELLLVRATADQDLTYMQKVIDYNTDVLADFDRFSFYYNVISFDNANFQFTLNKELRTLSFRGIGAQDSIRFITEYASSADGIYFRKPFEFEGKRYSTISQVDLDISAGRGSFMIGDSKAELLNQATSQSRYRLDAMTMFNLPYQYFSKKGFYKNGQEDGLYLSEIPGFYGILYYPRQFANGTDVMYILFNQGLNNIGPAFHTKIDSQGVMRFTNLLGYTGSYPPGLPQAIVDKLFEFRDVLLDEDGYHVYKTGTTGYDLVSVGDSRLWIRFN